MATIPVSKIYGAPTAGLQVVRQPRADYEDPGAQALRQISKGLDEVRVQAEESQNRLDLAKAEFDATVKADELQRSLTSDPTLTPEDLQSRYESGLRDIYSQAGQGLRSRQARQAWAAASASQLARGVVAGRDLADKRLIDNLRGSARSQIDAAMRIATDPNSSQEARVAAQTNVERILADRQTMRAFSAEEVAQFRITSQTALDKFEREHTQAKLIQTTTDDYEARGLSLAAGLEEAKNIKDPFVRESVETRWLQVSARNEKVKAVALNTAQDTIHRALFGIGETALSMPGIRAKYPEAYALVMAEDPEYITQVQASWRSDILSRRQYGDALVDRANEAAARDLYSRAALDPSLLSNPDRLRSDRAWGSLSPRMQANLIKDASEAMSSGSGGAAAATASAAHTIYERLWSSAQLYDPTLRSPTKEADTDRATQLRGAFYQRATELAASGSGFSTGDVQTHVTDILNTPAERLAMPQFGLTAASLAQALAAGPAGMGRTVLDEATLLGGGNPIVGLQIMLDRYNSQDAPVNTVKDFIARTMTDLNRPVTYPVWTSDENGNRVPMSSLANPRNPRSRPPQIPAETNPALIAKPVP